MNRGEQLDAEIHSILCSLMYLEDPSDPDLSSMKSMGANALYARLDELRKERRLRDALERGAVSTELFAPGVHGTDGWRLVVWESDPSGARSIVDIYEGELRFVLEQQMKAVGADDLTVAKRRTRR